MKDGPPNSGGEAFILRAFKVLERSYGLAGFKIYISYDANIPLPSVGSDVIVILHGDEHCRIPSYVRNVRIVLKYYGIFPNYVFRFRPLRLAQIEIFAFFRDFALWIPNGWRILLSKTTRDKLVVMPIGYGRATEIKPSEFEDRPYVVSFIGSLVQGGPSTSWLKRVIGSPKTFSRTRLIPVLENLKIAFGEEKVKFSITTGFYDSMNDPELGDSYFVTMANTKICLAPRGTAFETFRINEGLKFGCIVISDKLPRHSFYRGSPIIEIDDWRQLPNLINSLLADPIRMKNLHENSKRFWKKMMSEDAFAKRCATKLYIARDA